MLRLNQHISISLVLLSAIIIGALIGLITPASGALLAQQMDNTLLALISLLLLSIRFDALLRALAHLRFISVIIVINFMLIPLIGYLITSTLLPNYPLVMLGLQLYFVAPCTDWFLGFTKLAKGNVALGSVLIPINMVLQLLLYPLYLQYFNQTTIPFDPVRLVHTMWQWFLLPLCVTASLHCLLHWQLKPRLFHRFINLIDPLIPWFVAALVLEIFASNITIIMQYQVVFSAVLFAVFLFFIATFALSKLASQLFRLHYPEYALLTLSIAARNAPLMLAVTMAALPDQPLVYAAIIIGMLLEFPHLTLLRHKLLKEKKAMAFAEAQLNTQLKMNAPSD